MSECAEGIVGPKPHYRLHCSPSRIFPGRLVWWITDPHGLESLRFTDASGAIKQASLGRIEEYYE